MKKQKPTKYVPGLRMTPAQLKRMAAQFRRSALVVPERGAQFRKLADLALALIPEDAAGHGTAAPAPSRKTGRPRAR